MPLPVIVPSDCRIDPINSVPYKKCHFQQYYTKVHNLAELISKLCTINHDKEIYFSVHDCKVRFEIHKNWYTSVM